MQSVTAAIVNAETLFAVVDGKVMRTTLQVLITIGKMMVAPIIRLLTKESTKKINSSE